MHLCHRSCCLAKTQLLHRLAGFSHEAVQVIRGLERTHGRGVVGLTAPALSCGAAQSQVDANTMDNDELCSASSSQAIPMFFTFLLQHGYSPLPDRDEVSAMPLPIKSDL